MPRLKSTSAELTVNALLRSTGLCVADEYSVLSKTTWAARLSHWQSCAACVPSSVAHPVLLDVSARRVAGCLNL